MKTRFRAVFNMTRNKADVKSHYEDVTGDYEEFLLCSDPKSEEFRLQTILKLLDINPATDTVVDLGAGVCKLGLLWRARYPSAR